jgi:hypothetical protein
MEAVSTSQTSVIFYQTTRRKIPEDSHLLWYISLVSSSHEEEVAIPKQAYLFYCFYTN